MAMNIEVYSDSGGKARWRLTSSNGQTIASAGESYANRSNAKRAAAAFKANAAKAEFEVYADSAGKHRWRAKARNGQIVATGGEAFGSQSSAKRAATNVQNNVRDAAVTGTDAPQRGGGKGRAGQSTRQKVPLRYTGAPDGAGDRRPVQHADWRALQDIRLQPRRPPSAGDCHGKEGVVGSSPTEGARERAGYRFLVHGVPGVTDDIEGAATLGGIELLRDR